jgi:septal ring factor EnvC (AmiA/AmiB activator)
MSDEEYIKTLEADNEKLRARNAELEATIASIEKAKSDAEKKKSEDIKEIARKIASRSYSLPEYGQYNPPFSDSDIKISKSLQDKYEQWRNEK